MPDLMFGRYRVMGELGRGAMAVVYLAEDTQLERRVAVKALTEQHVDNQGFRERFRREGRILARAQHESIVPIYDTGEANGVPYLVMKLMPGGTLADRLAHGPLDAERALAVLSRVASALDAAHAAGVIHRDLKPANVLFDERDHAYVADFGVGRLDGASSGVTQPGTVIGTAQYMSPEQVQGADPTTASDIYSFGCLAYETLTGRPPFTGGDVWSLMRRHLESSPERPSTSRPWLAFADASLMAALSKRPEERPRSATAIIEAMRSGSAPASPQAGPETRVATVRGPVAPPPVNPPPAPRPVQLPPSPEPQARPTPAQPYPAQQAQPVRPPAAGPVRPAQAPQRAPEPQPVRPPAQPYAAQQAQPVRPAAQPVRPAPAPQSPFGRAPIPVAPPPYSPGQAPTPPPVVKPGRRSPAWRGPVLVAIIGGAIAAAVVSIILAGIFGGDGDTPVDPVDETTEFSPEPSGTATEETVTVTPTATQRPETGGRVFLRESFDGTAPSAIPEFSNQYGRGTILDGEYLLVDTADDGLLSWISWLPGARDVSISMRAYARERMITLACRDDSRYTVRASVNTQLQQFKTSTYDKEHSSFSTFVDWTHSDAISTTEKSTLELICRGDSLEFVINGQLVAAHTIAGTGIGEAWVGADGGVNAEIYLDDIVIKNLE